MFTAIIKKSTENAMQTFGTEVAQQVIDALSKKYGFDPEDARKFMGTLTLVKSSSKGIGKQKKKAPAVPIPFCGKIEDSWCQAIKSNHKMFTQCRNDKADGLLCKGCRTAANNNKGVPTYGFIQDRLNVDYKDKDGKKPKNFGNLMKTLGVTRDQAEAEAQKFGWTIPKEQFEVVEVKIGRPKKNEASDAKKADAKKTDAKVKEEKVKEEKEDVVISAFNRASSSTSSDDDEEELPVVDQRKRKKLSSKAPKTASIVTSDTSDEDTKPSKKVSKTNQEEDEEKINEEKINEEKIIKESDAIEETKFTSDDEEDIDNEIATNDVTEVTDCNGNTWTVDDDNKVYDDAENVVGRWDDVHHKVIRDCDEDSDDGSDISDMSSDEEED